MNAPVGPPMETFVPPSADLGERPRELLLVRLDAGRDGKRHRQRQRNNADRQPGREVGEESTRRIIFQRVQQLRAK